MRTDCYPIHKGFCTRMQNLSTAWKSPGHVHGRIHVHDSRERKREREEEEEEKKKKETEADKATIAWRLDHYPVNYARHAWLVATRWPSCESNPESSSRDSRGGYRPTFRQHRTTVSALSRSVPQTD
ncbi:hypothetical protein PUN28_014187 [Cardiocondyla obscurior]|uniref:Uncharacterized protein n=1 Tax=Cardiocondyla obscurior TaxID=286306 RepID=A0AAW2F0I1_9HYME